MALNNAPIEQMELLNDFSQSDAERLKVKL